MQAAIDYTPQKAFCVGHETAECVRTIFPTADIQTASVATQEGVVDLVLSHHPDHALWPRSSQARRHLPESLEKNGISVTELVLYAPVASSTPCSLDTVNIVFFTCPSSVDAFFDRFGQKLPATLSFQSIGPVTETRLVKYTQTC
jgi:uroporphyrinogen-III synthase